MSYIRLKKLLTEKKIPYTRLALMIGMPITTMFDKYHGKTKFSIEEAVKIKKALKTNLTIEELFKTSK